MLRRLAGLARFTPQNIVEGGLSQSAARGVHSRSVSLVILAH